LQRFSMTIGGKDVETTKTFPSINPYTVKASVKKGVLAWCISVSEVLFKRDVNPLNSLVGSFPF